MCWSSGSTLGISASHILHGCSRADSMLRRKIALGGSKIAQGRSKIARGGSKIALEDYKNGFAGCVTDLW